MSPAVPTSFTTDDLATATKTGWWEPFYFYILLFLYPFICIFPMCNICLLVGLYYSVNWHYYFKNTYISSIAGNIFLVLWQEAARLCKQTLSTDCDRQIYKAILQCTAILVSEYNYTGTSIIFSVTRGTVLYITFETKHFTYLFIVNTQNTYI